MKTEKKRTLKGSILFTVVSVLALMTIFMTSALALASAANKRAHKTYSNSQATYTARAAIDSILAAVGSDNDFASAVESLSENGKFDVIVNVNDPALGTIDKASVAYAGKTTIFDPKSKTWVEKNVLEISAEVTHGNETKTIVSHVIQDPVVQTDDGPGFLTMGGEGAENGNHANVLGGSYYGMGYGNNNGTWQSGLQYIAWNPVNSEITDISDKKYLTNKNFNIQNNSIFETPMVVNGNLTAPTNMVLYYLQKGKGFDIWGDFYCQNSFPKIQISDNLKNSLAGAKFNEIPYLYVDGQISIENQGFTLGVSKDVPYNLFCGSFSFKSGNPNIYADIYCFDKDKTSIYSTNSSNLYKWADSISGVGSGGGNIFSKGSLKIEESAGKTIEGDVRVEKDCIINGNATINGDLVVGGTLTLNSNGLNVGKSIYADNYTGNNIEIKNAELKPGYGHGNLNYVLAKDISFYTEFPVPDPLPDGTTLDDYIGHADYAWLYPSILDVESGTKIEGTKAIDFGGYIVEPQYYNVEEMFDGLTPPPSEEENEPESPEEGEENGEEENPPEPFVPDLNAEKAYEENVYYKELPDGRREKVEESEAMESAGAFYKSSSGNVPIKPLSEYRKIDTNIFPEYAEKENILGISGPVKGTEGRIIDYSALPAAVDESHPITKYSLVGDVTESCTLTGDFDKTVTVTTSGEDIYVLLSDVNFSNSEDPTLAKIEVNDDAGGNVYFAFKGSVSCNYNNPQELAANQVVKTVLEVMTTWQIEDNMKHPDVGKLNMDAVPPVDQNGAVIEIDAVDARLAGNYKGVVEITPPAADSIWIILDNLNLQTIGGYNGQIVINDVDDNGNQIGGTVNIYVKGDNTVNAIVTRSFLNFQKSNKTMQIVSDNKNPSLVAKDVGGNEYPYLPAPHVNVYSENNATLNLGNTGSGAGFITAYVRAPRMDLKLQDFTQSYDNVFSRLYYNGELLSKIKQNSNNNCQRLGIIGCLNAKSVPVNNNWLLLYIKEEGGGQQVKDANNAHTYASVDYMEY